jgi:hypothetical protein
MVDGYISKRGLEAAFKERMFLIDKDKPSLLPIPKKRLSEH